MKVIKYDEKEKFYFPNKHRLELENEKELIDVINPVKTVIKATTDAPLQIVPESEKRVQYGYVKLSNFPSRSEIIDVINFFPKEITLLNEDLKFVSDGASKTVIVRVKYSDLNEVYKRHNKYCQNNQI